MQILEQIRSANSAKVANKAKIWKDIKKSK